MQKIKKNKNKRTIKAINHSQILYRVNNYTYSRSFCDREIPIKIHEVPLAWERPGDIILLSEISNFVFVHSIIIAMQNYYTPKNCKNTSNSPSLASVDSTAYFGCAA